jgi:tetratricopeptide (TPR) repeat protein
LKAAGEFARTRQLLENALRHTSEWVGDHDIYAALADIAVERQDLEGLREFAPLAEETAARYGHQLFQGMAHRAWGVLHRLLGEFEQAEVHFQQALEVFLNLGTRWQTGKTWFEWGELEEKRGAILQAKEKLMMALENFEAIHAYPDILRTQQILVRLN